jgi:cytochrome P450
MRELHAKYGPVVRTAPDELSFIEAAAWKDIYCGGVGNKGMPKFPVVSSSAGFPSIISTNDMDHTVTRKILTPEFSTRTLREKEPLFQHYARLLVQKLRESIQERKDERGASPTAKGHTIVDIVKWLNFLTFDATGELIFTESFDCLNTGTTNPWVSFVLDFLNGLSILIACKYFSPLDKIFNWSLEKFVPSAMEQKAHFQRLTVEKGERRRQRVEAQLPDIMSALLANESTLGKDSVMGNATVLSLAGSETSATTLAGIFSYLTPEINSKLTAEVRSIKNESELTLVNIEKLPYLTAVIHESLRLGTPIPVGIPRITHPAGGTICGHWVEGNVR